MLIIGHRGAGGLAPENTIRSFKKAEKLGVDMIELDVRATKDNQIVVIHDANLKRLFANSSKVSGSSLADLKKISKAAGREIPTLLEVLQKIKIPLNLHVKTAGMEEQLLKLIKKFPHRILISSVSPEVLKKIRTLDGKIRLGLVIGKPELHLLFILDWLVRDLNLYSIHPKNILVSLVSMPILRWHKRKVIVWDVNKMKDYNRLVKLGVDGIITNFPQKFTPSPKQA